jgi:B9 domain-containing protein 2
MSRICRSFLEGEESSQTQYASSDDGIQVWNHPIDIHFASASIQGWPRMVMQVWELDEFGRSILAGYGFVHMPTSPGYHELEVHCWRPCGSVMEELNYYFLGTSSRLVDEDTVFGKAWEKRSQLKTVSSGIVSCSLGFWILGLIE